MLCDVGDLNAFEYFASVINKHWNKACQVLQLKHSVPPVQYIQRILWVGGCPVAEDLLTFPFFLFHLTLSNQTTC